MIDCNGYYSLRAILGYGCKYNIVLSDRGRGKSFTAKHFLMRQPGTAMCLFRNSSDMHMAMMSWIDPLVSGDKDLEQYEKYEAEQFEWEGNDKEGFVLYYNGSPKVWFRYLTQVNHLKLEVFPDDMNWVWLDEFIPLCYKKLPGIESEGDAIRTIIKTIEHDTQRSRKDRGLKEVRVILYANPFTWDNPILSYFKLRPREGIHRVGPGVVMEMLPPAKIEKKGKMTADDFLGNEVNTNQGWKDGMDHVVEEGKRPKNLIPVMSWRIKDKYFTLYEPQGVIRLYIKRSEGHVECGGLVTYEIWGSQDGLKENETCLDTSNILKRIKDEAKRGLLRYFDINSKFDFINAISEIR